jgi:prolyl-tRNA editing enzyme YbaK/EbsC (Cys-tRNA(Pro) deacylase)
MLVDETLQSPEITFNAGTHTQTLTITLSDYLDLTKAQRVDLAAIRGNPTSSAATASRAI